MLNSEVFCTFATKTERMILIADSGSTKTDWIVYTGNNGNSRVVSTQGINPFHQSDIEIEHYIEKRGIASISIYFR